MPELNKICYKKNFLKEVIVRVDFLNSLSGIDKKLPPPLSKIIAETFPIPEPKTAFIKEVKFSTNKQQQPSITKERELTEWHFHSKDRKKELVIIPNAAFIKYYQYLFYSDLQSDFEKLISAIFEQFPDTQGKRLGLRYINEIVLDEVDQFGWSDYLNNSLLGVFNFDKSNLNKTSRIFHNIEYNFDDFNLRYQFGIHNPDYPAQIKKKVFILDYDAYFQGILDESKIKSNIEIFHSKIQELFELSIKENLRSILNAEK